MSVSHITADKFDEEVIHSSQPVLVDFWAEWCGPCKAIAPILDEIAEEYKGRIRIAEIDLDVEENQSIAQKYAIRSIPTLILFKDGVLEDQVVGLQTKMQLTQLLDEKL
jgi:thioredoxin 1